MDEKMLIAIIVVIVLVLAVGFVLIQKGSKSGGANAPNAQSESTGDETIDALTSNMSTGEEDDSPDISQDDTISAP